MAYIDKKTKLGIKDEELIPLNTRWTFWIDRTDSRGLSAEDYERNLRKIFTVDTVQEFWQVFNNIPKVDEMECNFSYHLMREEYRPIREDPVHKAGGAWRLKCHCKDTGVVWKELLVAAIGEQLTDPGNPHELLGVSVALREHEDMVQLWHRDANAHAKSQILQNYRRILSSRGNNHFCAEFYKPHEAIGSNHSSQHGKRMRT